MINEQVGSSHGRANVGDVLNRVTCQKIVKFPVNILVASVEFVGKWRSVVTRNQVNKAREKAMASVEGNLKENETGYKR